MRFEVLLLLDRFRIFLHYYPRFLGAHLQLEVLFGNNSSPLHDWRVLPGDDKNKEENRVLEG